MVDDGRQIGEELSTVSTPPTVRSSVEDPEQANASFSGSGASTSKARERGESEGREPSGAVDTAWARALMSAEACRRGVCGYKNAEGPRDGRAAAVGCDGYHASRGLDPDGRPVVRWNLCPRHRAWWVAERKRRAARRAEV